MKARGQLVLAGVAISLLAAWNARELLAAWQHSPYDRLGWLAAIVWLVPLACYAGRRRPVPALFFAGLACSALGVMAELNALTYAGCALAGAGFLASEACALPWLGAAVSWMPLFGWMASTLTPGLANAARLLVAVAGAAFFLKRTHG